MPTLKAIQQNRPTAKPGNLHPEAQPQDAPDPEALRALLRALVTEFDVNRAQIRDLAQTLHERGQAALWAAIHAGSPIDQLLKDLQEEWRREVQSRQEALSQIAPRLLEQGLANREALLAELKGIEATIKSSGIEGLDAPEEYIPAVRILSDSPDPVLQKAARRVLGLFPKARQEQIEPKTRLPEAVPYSTFLEKRVMSYALADARSGDHWRDLEGEVALLYGPPGERHEIKFAGAPLLQWWDFVLSPQSLRSLLAKMGPDAALCLDLCLCLVIQDGRATVTLDEIIKGLGWDPRATAARQKARRSVWLWLTCFANMAVIGARPGTYKDPVTKKTLDLRSKDPLIVITGTREPIQQAFDGSEAPTEVSFVAGEWLTRWRKNPQIITYLGDVRKITSIPGGQPSGAWARSYAHVLLQGWRESAAKEKPLTITREGLHRLRPEPCVRGLLEGANPRRAIEYDREAWKLLKEAGIIGTDPTELAFTRNVRRGWQADFLGQEVIVRPGPDIEAQVSVIRSKAITGRGARKPATRRR